MLIQLRYFHFRKLHAEIIHPESMDPEQGSNEHAISVSHSIGKKPGEVAAYKLTIEVKIEPQTSGWLIEAELDSLFYCHPDLPSKAHRAHIETDGMDYLYGILRGQLAAITGAFAYGPFLLPQMRAVAN